MIKVKILRNNSYSHYSLLKNNSHETILDLLFEIKKEDSSLAFRSSCGQGVCGSCAVTINGKPRLACKCKITEVDTENLIIEPLKNRNTIKDLVVDINGFVNEIKNLSLISDSDNFSTKKIDMFKKSEDCIFCLLCDSSCKNRQFNSQFLSPASYVFAYKRLNEISNEDKKKDFLNNLQSVWQCASMYNCVEVCPMKIRPSQLIANITEQQIKHEIKSSIGAKHASAFNESIYVFGKLHEPYLLLRTYFPNHLGEMSRLGVKYTLALKIPSPFMMPIKGIKEVRRIYKNE